MKDNQIDTTKADTFIEAGEPYPSDDYPTAETRALSTIPAGSIPMERQLPPAEVMANAKEKAQVLLQAVEEAGLSYDLGGAKKHLGVQAWQILGKFDNATPRLVSTKRLVDDTGAFYGYEAKVEVYKQGQIIASADAMCTRDEPNWSDRKGMPVPEFQLRSMSQTRAVSKALRFAYGWIAVLAGYSDTPKEEMVGNEYDKKEISKPKPTKGQIAQAVQGNGDMCKRCGGIMVLKSGVKNGKPWQGWFCSEAPRGDRTHDVRWVKNK